MERSPDLEEPPRTSISHPSLTESSMISPDNRMAYAALLVLLAHGSQSLASDELTVPVTPLDVDETTVAAGIDHSCAIHTALGDVAGRIHCWGSNTGGQSIPPSGEFIQVSTGRLHTCAIRADETVICWGFSAAVKKPSGLFDQISSGDFHSCGLLKDKTIQCWGSLAGGVAVPPAGKFIQVSCGRDFSCALTPEGKAQCWGENRRGVLTPPSYVTFRQISASPGDFACGVTVDKDVECWGDDHRGQCSPPKEKFNLVSASRLSACGIKTDKTVVCWGMRSGVTAAPKDVKFDELSLGWNHGCGIRYEDSKLQCWGDSSGGRLDIPSVLLK